MSLPTNLTYLLRALKGAPLACLFALPLSDEPASQSWLMQSTGYSPNSVSAALRLLDELGLAMRSNASGDWCAYRPLAAELAASLKLVSNSSPVVEPDPSKFEGPLGGGEESTPDINDFPPPPAVDLQIEAPLPAHLSTESILEATRELFGESVYGPPERYRDQHLLLATIAEVHQGRHHLNSPARVVYTRLKSQVNPAPVYLEDPCAYLPQGFLTAIGLSPRSPPAMDDPPDEDDDPEAEDPQSSAHTSLSLPTGANGSHTILSAWQSAYETLQTELPPAAFKRRVADLRLLRYDPAAVEFTFAAPDAQTAAWLTDRLAVRLTRLLAGICNRTVRVKFVEDAVTG